MAISFKFKMDWFEIIIKVPTEQCEVASAIANMTVPYGIYIEDYSDMEIQSAARSIGIADSGCRTSTVWAKREYG